MVCGAHRRSFNIIFALNENEKILFSNSVEYKMLDLNVNVIL